MLAIAAPFAAAQDARTRVTPETNVRRLAIVIGNDAYPAAPLRNSVNDANAMSRALTDAGFVVDLVLNAALRDMGTHVDRFLAQVQPGDVAMVYYSGHGVQVDGENYLVPTDFTSKDETDTKYTAYSATRIVDRLNGSGARLSILVLDACRDNPFRSTRGGGSGLNAMEAQRGTLIALATAAGRTADDNPRGENGLFTSYLLESIRQPNLTAEQVFARTRQSVFQASGGKQLPLVFSSVVGDFYFHGSTATAADDSRSFVSNTDPRSAVVDLLSRYRRAYETMNADALMQIYPSFRDRAALEARFKDFAEVAMALGTPTITITSPTTASATMSYSITYTSKTGRMENTRPVRATFDFKKAGAVWVIDDVRFR